MRNISDILDAVPEIIFRRGEDYYKSDSIISLSRSSEGVFTGAVSGSGGETYEVRVQADENGEVSDVSCSCPYDYGDVCKHIVAVLLAVGDGNFSQQKQAKAEARNTSVSSADLPKLLKALPREQLLAIILAKAEQDEDFESALILETAPPDAKSDLSIIKAKIRRSIRSNTRKGFIDDMGCDAICAELSDCLDFAADRLKKGQALSAFEVALHVLLTGADLASGADSSSGSLTFVMDESFEKLEGIYKQILENSNNADRDYCYEKLCKEALSKVLIGWNHWSYDLLLIATLLVNEKNRDKIDEALKGMRERQKESTYAHYEMQEALVKLKVIRILEGDKAARAFIDDRLAWDEFRELALDDDLRKGDYENAEKLCMERIIQLDRRPFGRPADWWYRLYEIHEKMNDRTKLLATAKALLLQGDIDYYRKLKALLCEDNKWEESYPLLRSELKTTLSGFLYARILDIENEHALLLEEVKRDSSSVFQYGKKLAQHYPAVVYELYCFEIAKFAKESSNRSQYGKLCGLLKELHRAGGKDEALALADRLIEEYKRRPAMLDELANLKRGLARPRQ